MSWQNLELLAPAGTPEVLEAVAEAGADAVYLGGKRFNMRLLRPEFNFSDNELIQAVDYLHQRQKKLYVTVNNLYKQEELNDIQEYLLFLSESQVDALIIQDLGLLQLCREMNLQTPIHASVQMGINNLEAVRLLEEHGVSRVILSKNLALNEIKAIHDASSIGIEFFAHGDLCVSHTGQCFFSSYIFGDSGNRGRCRKPCRWPYRISGPEHLENIDSQYYLAYKDLCLYPFLADLIQAGVSSFKIEGRMRSKEQLVHIINAYRQGLDEYMSDPIHYKCSEILKEELYEKRIRDYTNGSLFTKSNYEEIGLSGEREPFFPTEPKILNRLNPETFSSGQDKPDISGKTPEITISIADMKSLQMVLPMGIDNIILGMDNIRQCSMDWGPETIKKALQESAAYNSKLLIETPRIVSQKDLDAIYTLAETFDPGDLHGFIVNDLGSLHILNGKGFNIWTGYGLKINNVRANTFMHELGVERITASLEMDENDLYVMLMADIPMELMVQGPLPGMVTDLCIISSVNDNHDTCTFECMHKDLALKDELGQTYRIYSDINCRNYLFHPQERCLMPYLPKLISDGLRSIRIDGQFYQPELLINVIRIYQQTLLSISKGSTGNSMDFHKLLDLFPDGLTAMPLFEG